MKEMLLRLITTTFFTTTTALLVRSSSSLSIPCLSYPVSHRHRAALLVSAIRSHKILRSTTIAMTTEHTNHLPSREELRRLRLVAMFGKRDNDDENNEEPALKKLKVTNSGENDVIDLLDADSSNSSGSASDNEGDNKESAVAKYADDSAESKIGDQRGKKQASRVVDLLFDDSSNCSDNDDQKVVASKKKIKKKAPPTQQPTRKTKPTETSPPMPLESANDISFHAASYNLWFGTQRNGHPHAQARMQAVADILLSMNANDSQSPLYFMAFQEVVHGLDEALFPILESAGYQMIRQPLGNPMFDPYGVALAVHPSVTVLDGGWNTYRFTQMDRGFVYAQCRLPNGLTCVVTSTHLESWAGKEMNGSVERVQQLNAMEDFCNQLIETKRTELAIMMGDLNWDDTSRNPTDPVLDDVLSSVEWKDAWLETNHLRKTVDARKGYTYDAKLNPMLGVNLRRRFDRCLVRSARPVPVTSIVSTSLLGQDALPGLLFEKENPYTGAIVKKPTAPSDHFCLLTEIRASSSDAEKQGSRMQQQTGYVS